MTSSGSWGPGQWKVVVVAKGVSPSTELLGGPGLLAPPADSLGESTVFLPPSSWQ